MRSKWKLPFVDYKLLSVVQKSRQQPIRVFARNSVILSDFVGFRFHIYNGKIFKLLIVSKDMVGLKFGEFAFTKKLGFSIHKKKITKKIQKKSKQVLKKNK